MCRIAKFAIAMENIRINKEFRFEMAHALYGYDGPCKNIHGHSYRLNVCLIGTVNKQKNHPKSGMVMDFGELKNIIQEEVLNEFDHALVVNANSPHGKINFDLFEKVIRTPFQPTCENLLLEFVRRIKKRIPKKLQLHHLILHETATAYASWYASDN